LNPLDVRSAQWAAGNCSKHHLVFFEVERKFLKVCSNPLIHLGITGGKVIGLDVELESESGGRILIKFQ
jgi:hypothetical protein